LQIEPEVEATAPVVQSTAGVTAATSVTAALTKAATPRSIWSLLNQLQMLILFLLIDTYIASDVRSFIIKQEFALFSFNFIPVIEIPYINYPAEWMEKAQEIEELELLGLESSRTFNNMYSLMCVILTSIVMHLLLRASPEFKWKWYKFLRLKMLEYYMNGYYVRLILGANEFMILSSVSEIKQFDLGNIQGIISFFFA